MKDLSWAYFAFVMQILFVYLMIVKSAKIEDNGGVRYAAKGFLDGAFFAYIAIYLVIFVVILISMIRMALLFGEFIPWLLASLLLVGLGIWASLKLRKGRQSVKFLISFLVALPFFVSAYLGINKGFFDAFGYVPQDASGFARCGERVIHRSIGEYYLASSREGARYLIDGECRDRFILIKDEFYIKQRNIFDHLMKL